MKNKFLIYSLAGLLSSVAVSGFADSIQAQSSTASESSQQSRSIQVDQHFIEMMIPHHQDAIAMADLALIPKHKEETTDDIREKGERGQKNGRSIQIRNN